MKILEKIRITNLLNFFATQQRLPISGEVVDFEHLRYDLLKMNYKIHSIKFLGKFEVEMIVINSSNKFYTIAN